MCENEIKCGENWGKKQNKLKKHNALGKYGNEKLGTRMEKKRVLSMKTSDRVSVSIVLSDR